MTRQQLASVIYLAGYVQRYDGKWFPREKPWSEATRTADWLIAQGVATIDDAPGPSLVEKHEVGDQALRARLIKAFRAADGLEGHYTSPLREQRYAAYADAALVTSALSASEGVAAPVSHPIREEPNPKNRTETP